MLSLPYSEERGFRKASWTQTNVALAELGDRDGEEERCKDRGRERERNGEIEME